MGNITSNNRRSERLNSSRYATIMQELYDIHAKLLQLNLSLRDLAKKEESMRRRPTHFHSEVSSHTYMDMNCASTYCSSRDTITSGEYEDINNLSSMEPLYDDVGPCKCPICLGK